MPASLMPSAKLAAPPSVPEMRITQSLRMNACASPMRGEALPTTWPELLIALAMLRPAPPSAAQVPHHTRFCQRNAWKRTAGSAVSEAPTISPELLMALALLKCPPGSVPEVGYRAAAVEEHVIRVKNPPWGRRAPTTWPEALMPAALLCRTPGSVPRSVIPPLQRKPWVIPETVSAAPTT